MIKHLVALVCGIILSTNLFAQDKDAEIIKTKKDFFKPNTTYQKPSRDFVMLQAGYHTWLLNDSVNIDLKNRGHELNAYLCYDFPMQKANFSFALGVGISSSNIYLDSMVMPINRFNATYNTVQFQYDTSDFKRYKVSHNYFEAPFEFRYYGNKVNRNRGFKLAIGAKVGTLINAHTKGVFANNAKVKEANRRYQEQWRIVPTIRIGWGNFSVFGNYQISNMFKAGNVQGITPATVGICISGL
jgi:hypothetical protein